MPPQGKRRKSSHNLPMAPLGYYGHFISIRETSEEHQQSVARQPAGQHHHHGSASGTSHTTSTGGASYNSSTYQNIGSTVGSQSLTPGSEPQTSCESKPCHPWQLNQPSEHFQGQNTTVNRRQNSTSDRPGHTFNGSAQFQRPTHQSPAVVSQGAYGAREAIQPPSEQGSSYSYEDLFTRLVNSEVYENSQGQAQQSVATFPATPVAPTASGQVHQDVTGLGSNAPPWNSVDQGRYRELTEQMLQMDFSLNDGTHLGGPAYPNLEDLNRRSHTSDFDKDIHDVIQDSHQARSSYKDWQIDGSPEVVYQRQPSQHGYHEAPPPGCPNFVNRVTNPLTSSSDAQSHASAATSSIAPDPLPCTLCDASFTRQYRKGNRARHMRLKHGLTEESFKCPVKTCDKTFSRNDALLKHGRKHHPELRIAEPIRRKEDDTGTQNPARPRHDSQTHVDHSMNFGEMFYTETHDGGSLLPHDEYHLELAGKP